MADAQQIREQAMCELYVKADPILYESRSRSLRIRGVVTTLRLELSLIHI